MSRLIDILSKSISTDHLIDGLPELVRASRNYTKRGQCEVIVADNVAHYVFSREEKPFIDFEISDFPNIAPPFDNMLVEWKTPTRIYQKRGVFTYHPEYKDGFAGTHIMSARTDLGWNCLFVFYAALKSIAQLVGYTATSVGKDGSVLSSEKMVLLDQVVRTSKKVYGADSLDVISFLVTAQTLFPTFLTISFMHCKNVELKNTIPSAPLSKKHEKKYGKPLIRYKILEIEPMRKVLESEGQDRSLGLKHALHICRGHFKDYTEHGLFGKYKGLYWWDSHVRGDSSRGTVVKDYSIGSVDTNAIMS